MNAPEPVVKINIYDPLELTAEEYESLALEVAYHLMVDAPTVGTRILAAILKHNNGRYLEILEIRKSQNAVNKTQ